MDKSNYYDLNYSLEDISNYESKSQTKPYPKTSSTISKTDETTCLLGNNVNFSVNEHDSEIKADIVVGYHKSVRVWGQVKDCNGHLIPCAYVKLLKVTPNGLVGIAHTLSDCQGFYQFDICVSNDGCNFTIVVGSAATGNERVVSTGLAGTSCNSIINGNICNTNPCNNSCD
ncbi:MAG: hypothetical protein ACRDA5_15140 [Clostridium sp.]